LYAISVDDKPKSNQEKNAQSPSSTINEVIKDKVDINEHINRGVSKKKVNFLTSLLAIVKIVNDNSIANDILLVVITLGESAKLKNDKPQENDSISAFIGKLRNINLPCFYIRK
jgi:hypothetical protein